MRIFSIEGLKTLALFTLAPVVLVLALDFWVAPEPVVGTVVNERFTAASSRSNG